MSNIRSGCAVRDVMDTGGLDFEPDEQHTVADMANVGYALMQAIKVHRPGYCWNDSPAEIVGDLCGELSEGSSVEAGDKAP